MLDDLLKLLEATSPKVAASYEDRVVANEEVEGLRVSTAYTVDMGYETAICDVNGVYPVERYVTKEEARSGHKKWVKKATNLKEVVRLGYKSLVKDTKIKLEKSNRYAVQIGENKNREN